MGFPRSEAYTETRIFPFLWGILIGFSAFTVYGVAYASTELFVADNRTFFSAFAVAILSAIIFWIIDRQETSKNRVIIAIFLSYIFLTLLVRWIAEKSTGASPATVAFVSFTAAQSVLLTGIFLIASEPIEPKEAPIRPKKRKKFLKLHLRNWWRMAYFFTTFSIALGISLLFDLIPQPATRTGMISLGWLSLPIGIQLGFILVYVKMKMDYVESQYAKL